MAIMKGAIFGGGVGAVASAGKDAETTKRNVVAGAALGGGIVAVATGATQGEHKPTPGLTPDEDRLRYTQMLEDEQKRREGRHERE